MENAFAQISIPVLFGAIGVLFLLSAFFSGSETALMSVNRYHLATLAGRGRRSAKIALHLLKKPDRLIGLILLGNNLVNILITQISTYVGYRLYGDLGIAIATGALTLLILVFAEAAPKTAAVTHAERASLFAAPILGVLSFPARPLVWLISAVNDALLKLFGTTTQSSAENPLTHEELRQALVASRRNLRPEYQDMLLSIFNLEKLSVREVMVPINEVVGINLEDSFEDIRNDLANSIYTRLPLYRGTISRIEGYVHTRDAMRLLCENTLSKEALIEIVRPCEYLHENTHLFRGLLEMKRLKRMFTFVVDEYGDIQGLLTLDDMLEEIVGDFTRDPAAYDHDIVEEPSGSVIVDANCRIDELNEQLKWDLKSTDRASTLNGIILERMEYIPEPGTSVLINNRPVEVLKATSRAVQKVRIGRPIKEPLTPDNHAKQ